MSALVQTSLAPGRVQQFTWTFDKAFDSMYSTEEDGKVMGDGTERAVLLLH